MCLAILMIHITSLLNHPNFLNPEMNINNSITWENFRKDLLKKMKIKTQAGALRDYCKNKIIPKGLHMNKVPGVFPHNEEFKDRWVSILNKC